MGFMSKKEGCLEVLRVDNEMILGFLGL